MTSFTANLEHIPVEAPRDPNQLHGLMWSRGINRSYLIFLLLPFVFLMTAFPLVMMIDPHMHAADASTKRATARVLRVEKAVGELDRAVVYSFATARDDVHYGIAFLNSKSAVAHLKPGEPLTIYYSPANPGVSYLRRPSREEVPWSFFFMLPLMLLPFAAPAFLPVPKLWRARRIFRRGRWVSGQVDFVRPTGVFNPVSLVKEFEVLFSYQDASGKIRQGKQSSTNDWLIHQWTAGSPVSVIFLPGKSEQSIVVEAYLE